MIAYLLDSVDWFEVMLNAPIAFSGFGVGLCVRSFVSDCINAPTGW